MGKNFKKEEAVKLTLEALCNVSDKFCTINGQLHHRTHKTRGFWLWKEVTCSLGPTDNHVPYDPSGCLYCNRLHGVLDEVKEDLVNISHMVVFAHESTDDLVFFDSDDVNTLEWYTDTEEEEEDNG